MKSYYIPKPCHENWNLMTPQEQGRHCDVCSKVVVDFSQKSPQQVVEIMETAEGSVCGNFKLSQLDQTAQMKVFKNPSNLFNRNIKYLALTVFGLFAFNKKSEAQKLRGKVALRGDVAPIDYHDTNADTSKLHGTVKDKTGQLLAGATITVSSNNKVIATGNTLANGSYVIKIAPGKIEQRKITVSVSHSYYMPKLVTDLSITKENTGLQIVLEDEIMMLGEVMYIPEEVDTVAAVEESTIDTTTNSKTEGNDGLIEDNILDKPLHQIICDETYDVEENQINKSEQNNTPNEEKTLDVPEVNLVARPEDIQSLIFPNPTNQTTTIYCNKSDAYKVELFDNKGSLIKTVDFNGTKTQLDVSNLERGNYIVKVQGAQGTSGTHKLVKQ